MAIKTATFAAGCFWGPQSKFDSMDGIVESHVGYMGGHTSNPTYEDICAKGTGHAEVVRVRFDDDVVSYDALLEAFFAMHDPTQVNRQGPDLGDQYRTAIFPDDATQADAAKAKIETLNGSGQFSQPVATSIEDAKDFWMAEDHHQKYNARRGLGRLFG